MWLNPLLNGATNKISSHFAVDGIYLRKVTFLFFFVLLVFTLLVMISKEKSCVPDDQRIPYLMIISNALLLLAFSVTARL